MNRYTVAFANETNPTQWAGRRPLTLIHAMIAAAKYNAKCSADQEMVGLGLLLRVVPVH